MLIVLVMFFGSFERIEVFILYFLYMFVSLLRLIILHFSFINVHNIIARDKTLQTRPKTLAIHPFHLLWKCLKPMLQSRKPYSKGLCAL